MRVSQRWLHWLRRPLVILLVLLAPVCCIAGGQEPPGAAGYAQGEAFLRSHQWDQGLAVLEPLLKAAPQDIRLLNLVGLAYTGKGDPRRGDGYFVRALVVNPAFVPSLKNLAVNELGQGDTKAAKEHLIAAFKQAPGDPVVNLYLGEIFYREGDYQQAARYLPRAGEGATRNRTVLSNLAVSYLKTGHEEEALAALAETQPSMFGPEAQFALGIALIEAGMPDRAVPYLEAVHGSYSTSTDVAYDLAICYVAAKQYPQAIAIVRALIDHGHESAEIDNISAEAYEGNKETQSAVDALRRAIALDPSSDDNYLDFASLCIDHQSFEQAAQVLEVGLSIHPGSARLIFERGLLNAMQDHFDQAEKDFQQSAALAPQDRAGDIGLSVAYLETGNTAQAKQLLRKQTAEHPNDANLAYLLGEALIRSGAEPGQPEFSEAQSELEKSVRLNASLSEPGAALGSIYLRLGRLQDAIVLLEQARKLDPKNKSAYSHLAVAYRRLGEQDKAKEVISRLQEINAAEREGPRKLKTADTSPAAPTPGDSN